MIQDQLVVGQLYQIDDDVQGTYLGYSEESKSIYFKPKGNSGIFFLSSFERFDGCVGFIASCHTIEQFPIVEQQSK